MRVQLRCPSAQRVAHGAQVSRGLGPLVVAAAIVTFACVAPSVAATSGKGSEDEASLGNLDAIARRAVRVSREVKQAKAQWQQSLELVRQAQGAFFPSLSFNSIARSRQDPSVLRRSNVAAFSAREEYNAQLILSQPLYAGGALTSSQARAEAQAESDRLRMEGVSQQVIERVTGLVADVWERERLLVAAQGHLAQLERHLEITKRHERIGRSRTMDRLQASVNVTLLKAELGRLESERKLMADRLRRELDLPVTGEAWQAPLSAPSLKVEAKALSVSHLVERAEQQNPEFQLQKLSRRLQEAENAQDWSEELPSLRLEGALGYRAFDSTAWWDESSRYYFVGLNLTVPLFNGLTSFARRRSYLESLKRIDEQLENVRLVLHSDLDQVVTEIRNLEVQLQGADSAERDSARALALANEGYKTGIANHLDVLNAQTTAYQALRLKIQTQALLLRALARLQRLFGEGAPE